MSELAKIGADFFLPHVGSIVALADAQGNVVLTAELRGVTPQPRSTAPDAGREAFSLFLVAPEPCAVADGDFVLAHPGFGTFGPVHVIRTHAGTLSQSEAVFQIYFN